MNFHLIYAMCCGSAMVVAVVMVRLAFKQTIVTNIGNSIILGGVISSVVTHIFYATCWQSIFAIIPAGMVIFFLILKYIQRKIQLPLQTIVAISNAISQGKLAAGDFSGEVFVSENELGQLSRSINATYRDLSGIVADIMANIKILTETVDVLVGNSNQLQENSAQMKTQADNVAAASKEMTAGISTVSSNAEESAGNLHTISSSIEQMSSTVNEISRNTELARGISGDAVSQADRTAANIRRLEESAEEANTIIDTINEVVDQTKLLSLNATIEAARAGEYGKGFAVVAGEVKELADQTEHAVIDIRQKLSAINRFREEAVRDMEQITGVIKQVDEVVSSIASSIEEQNITTRDIAENVEGTNRGVAEVNRQVEESATIFGRMAEEIANLNRVVAEVGAVGDGVRNSAEKLSHMSAQMEQVVEKFELVDR